MTISSHPLKAAKDDMMENSPTHKRVLMLPSALGRSHLTRLVLIALELQRQGVEVAFAFKENSQILEHYEFKVFPVSDAVVTDFSSNVFAAYTPSLFLSVGVAELT